LQRTVELTAELAGDPCNGSLTFAGLYFGSTQQSGSLPLYGQMMAASLVCAAPVVLLFLVFQRYLVSGLSAGALK
jgi:trehalose/maltose transport system permease protein